MKRPSESHFSDGLLSFISALTGIKDKNTIAMELNPIIEKKFIAPLREIDTKRGINRTAQIYVFFYN